MVKIMEKINNKILRFINLFHKQWLGKYLWINEHYLVRNNFEILSCMAIIMIWSKHKHLLSLYPFRKYVKNFGPNCGINIYFANNKSSWHDVHLCIPISESIHAEIYAPNTKTFIFTISIIICTFFKYPLWPWPLTEQYLCLWYIDLIG